MSELVICANGRTKGKILLINPDFVKNILGSNAYPENHLGLQRLASYLEQQGIPCGVLNATGGKKGTTGPMDLADILRREKENYECIGFYVSSWTISPLLDTLRAIQPEYKEVPIFLGGPLPTAEPKKVLDLLAKEGFQRLGIIAGYGEFLLEKVLRDLENFASVEGVYSLVHGEYKAGKLIQFTQEELKSLPFLHTAFNTFYQQYYKPVLESGSLGDIPLDMIFGAMGLDCNQGCPFTCSYCTIPFMGQKVAVYDPVRVVAEMEHIAEETGIFMFTFTYSNIMFYQRAWIQEFMQEILRRNMQHYLVWTGYNHPNMLDMLTREDYQTMWNTGCSEVVFGVQSADPEILTLFKRPKDTGEKLGRIVERTRGTGLRLVVDHISGVPGERISYLKEFYAYCGKEGIECRDYLLKLYPRSAIVNAGLDYSAYDIVPIMGNLAPELESYAVIPKLPDAEKAQLQETLRMQNMHIRQQVPIRFGNTIVEKPEDIARIKAEVRKNPHIPEKVKRALAIMLTHLGTQGKNAGTVEHMNPKEMLAMLFDEGSGGSVMKETLRRRLKTALGEEQFQRLEARYKKPKAE